MICSLCVAVFMLFTFTIFTFPHILIHLHQALSVSDYLQMRKIYSEKPPFCPLQICLFHSYFALCGTEKVPTEAHFSAPRANFY